jgi:hypothetical protein
VDRAAAARVRGRRAGSGPFDSADPAAASCPGGLDFGSLRIPLPARAQLQVEEDSSELLRAVHVLVPSGRVSLSALAAPRSEPLWRALAEEIADSLAKDGARVRTEWGEWGREVQASSRGAVSRFIGVDGPRWMLYGVATGPVDGADELAATLREMIRGTVVTRGPEPLPVKTVLRLQPPEQLEESVTEARGYIDRSSDPALTAAAPPGSVGLVSRSIGVRRVDITSPLPRRSAALVDPPGRPAVPAAEHRPASPPPPTHRTPTPTRPPAPPTPRTPRTPPPSRRGPMPPVPAGPRVSPAAAEGTWSLALPVVSSDQVAQEPAWALLGEAPTFWPTPPPRDEQARNPRPGPLDDPGFATRPLPELTRDLLDAPSPLHDALTRDAAVARERVNRRRSPYRPAPPAGRPGRHRRAE